MSLPVVSTIIFACAILHTFLVAKITHFAHSLKKDSFRQAFVHLLGEVEIVFGFWAAIFIIYMSLSEEPRVAIEYLEKLKFTEPLFVFAVMVICATEPVLTTSRHAILFVSGLIHKLFKVPAVLADVFVLLGMGPLLGSFITEPAAITVVALLIRSMMTQMKPRTLYFLLAILFVNISVGGAMTPFAAPPILMVAQKWGWGLQETLQLFALRSVFICLVNAAAFLLVFRKEIQMGFRPLKSMENSISIPWGVQILNLVFLALIVLNNHYSNVFMGIFLFYLGFAAATMKFQRNLRLRESLLVAFFLGGLMVFGEFQQWWLQPLLAKLSDTALFFGATALTAVTDNAALTFLGSQVESLTDSSKFALVAGALAGGGLTVLANAPNPAGYSIFAQHFPEKTINPIKLLMAAMLPTLTAILFFWLL